MKIAIIGSGRIGGLVGKLWAQAGVAALVEQALIGRILGDLQPLSAPTTYWGHCPILAVGPNLGHCYRSVFVRHF